MLGHHFCTEVTHYWDLHSATDPAPAASQNELHVVGPQGNRPPSLEARGQHPRELQVGGPGALPAASETPRQRARQSHTQAPDPRDWETADKRVPCRQPKSGAVPSAAEVTTKTICVRAHSTCSRRSLTNANALLALIREKFQLGICLASLHFLIFLQSTCVIHTMLKVKL